MTASILCSCIALRSAAGSRIGTEPEASRRSPRLARAGVGLSQAQRLLGHSDPKLTAQAYTHLDAEDLRDAVAFLVEIMRREEGWLVERSQRELERLLGRDLGTVPPRGEQRDAWLTTLLEVLDEGR